MMFYLSIFWRTLFVILCLLAGSCEEENLSDTNESSIITPLIDSNTNWLLACAEDADCDEGRCSCGACIIPCQAEMGCRLNPEAEQAILINCRESEEILSDLTCGDDMPVTSGQMCIPACDADLDCPPTFRCRDNNCIPPPRMRDEACEEECGRSGRESRRCYVECQRAQRRRQEEYIRMSMSDGESMRSMPSAPMDE